MFPLNMTVAIAGPGDHQQTTQLRASAMLMSTEPWKERITFRDRADWDIMCTRASEAQNSALRGAPHGTVILSEPNRAYSKCTCISFHGRQFLAESDEVGDRNVPILRTIS